MPTVTPSSICIAYRDKHGLSVYKFTDRKNKNEHFNEVKFALLRDIEKFKVLCDDYALEKEYWENEIINTKKKIDTLFITTLGEFFELEKKEQLSIPIKEITEEKFYEMLDCLPPLQWETVGKVNQFCMSEFWTGNYTNQYGTYRGHYFIKRVDFEDSSTYLSSNTDILDKIIEDKEE